MSPKSVAFLVVGMLVISSVFFMFHVTYPANPATIKLNPPKNVQPPNLQIFSNQSANFPHLGLNQTSFSPTGNTSLTLEGYVYNASNQQTLANQKLGIAVMQAFTLVTTNSTGYYRVQIKASGQGVFAFKVFQYNTRLYDLMISPGVSSLTHNIILTPQVKYNVSGYTQSHGNDIPSVGLIFHNFWGNYTTQSSLGGSYGLKMVDGLYTITDFKNGFSPVPDPINVTIDNTSRVPFNIQLNSSNQAALYMSGYVHNDLGNPVSGATIDVTYPALVNSTAITSKTGYYNISVAYYSNTIGITATGYSPYSQVVMVTKNLVDQNFTISSLDPFVSPIATGNQPTGPAGLGTNVSAVNYAVQNPVTVSGKIILNQTGLPVPDQQFIVYTSVNGTFFFDQIQTDGSGNYTISLQYHGDYVFAITSTTYYEAWLNKTLDNSLTGVPIYVKTSGANIYHISGHLYNGVTNGSMVNSTINITSSSGQFLGTVNVSSSGNFSFNLTGGNYNLNISAPGFGSKTVPLNVTGNVSNLNLTLNPTTGISTGSTQWSPSSGTGLPGVNNTSVVSQINSAQNSSGQSPSTASGTPVVLRIQMVENNTQKNPIVNTSFVLFIKVNGLYLRVTNTTNSTGGALLPLSYGGTYIILPEMIDYSGNAQFINTSTVNQPIVFKMDQLPSYLLQVNLSNPLGSYNGSNVPISGLTGDGYYLPIKYSSYESGTNFTLANYSLPNGTYSFSYIDKAYVSDYFNVTMSGNSTIYNGSLDPYALILNWSSPVTWGYRIIGPSGVLVSENMGNAQGTGTTIFGLYDGTFTFYSYINGTSAKNAPVTLSPAAYEDNLTFNVQQYSMNISQYLNKSVYFNINNSTADNYSATLNYTIDSLNSIYISSFLLNVSSIYSVNTYIDGQLQSGATFSGGTINLPNYFATGSSGATKISIVADGITLQEFSTMVNNVTMVYYGVTLR